LPNALGNADAVLKGAEAECKALKDEIKRRGLLEAAGDSFAIRVSEQISGRLDVQCGSTQHARTCASRRRPIHSRLTPRPRVLAPAPPTRDQRARRKLRSVLKR
jgi:hypothetical protein